MTAVQSHPVNCTRIPPPSPSPSDKSPPQWRIHWSTPVLMGLTFILGICTSILHDFLYQSCVGKPAVAQQWYTRAGTGLAFLTKALFVSCIGISHRQRIWYTLRSKYITIGGINALFGATVNPFSLFNLDMMLNSKLSATMAILAWLVPLSAIVTPATLSVMTKEVGPFYWETTVPYIDLTNSGPWYTQPGYNMSLLGVSLSYWSSNRSDHIYNGPSELAKNIAQSTFFGGSILPILSPITSNYSYMIEFYGPALSCNYTGNEITTQKPKYGTIYLFKSALESVDESSVDGKLGLRQRLRVYADSHPNGNKSDEGRTTQNALCIPYNATYSVYINFTLGIPVYTIRNLTLLSPLDESVDTKANQGYGGSVDSENSANAWPSRSVISAIYYIISGWISFNPPDSGLRTETQVHLTKLSNNTSRLLAPMKDITFVNNISSKIEEMSHNLTLSLLSISDAQIRTTIQYSESRLVFIYSRWVLITAYGSAVTAALVCLVTGLLALGANGISSDITFSRVLVTTRNIQLDNLVLGACLGGDPFPKDLRKQKLKFGELEMIKDEEGNDVSHAGFGLQQVVSLQKGKKYM